MKLCARHVDDLNRQIRRKGMGKFMSATEEIARTRAMKWLRGTATPADFDPQVVATFEIYKKAQELVGDFDGCPICRLPIMAKKDITKEWIDNVTDALVLFCEANNLKRG